MKKITFGLIVILFSLKLQAQNSGSELYTTEVDRKLQSINKSSITSNILLDRTLSVSGILEFNQGARRDTTSYEHFKQVWYELHQASYTKNFASIKAFSNQLSTKNYANNVIPIGVINTEFHYGNAGTPQNPNVQFNSTTQTFSNIAGKNPFAKKQTTIIAPLTSKVIGNSIQFKMDSDSKLYKHGKRIKTLQLLTNGTSFNLITNYVTNTSPFQTTYTTKGIKIIQFKATLSDNTQKISYAQVYVDVPKTNILARTNTSLLREIEADNDLAFQGYDENQAYRGKNEYRIYYNDNSSTLDKPLIILDGFDPEDKRKIEKNDIGHNPNTKSIYELMAYDHDNNSNTEDENLIEELNSKGYDVIVVNHKKYTTNGKQIDGGTDYIERNAYVLISLIRKLKRMQQGNEEMVIIGPSMGGLISRYALAYMEKKLTETGDNTKWNHKTRLWVSFDSPHQGANVPIGVQRWLRFHDFVGKVKEKINVILNSPAAKQMLVHHLFANSSSVKGAPNFRDRFQNNLNALGMPNNLRKVALVNGSMSGKRIGTPSQEILNIKLNSGIFTRIANIAALGLLLNFEGIHSNVYFTPDKNKQGLVFDGRVRVSTFFIGWNIHRKRMTVSSDSRGSYDNSPGGYADFQHVLYEEADLGPGFFLGLLVRIKRSLKFPTHSFIPTKSALAYTGSEVLDENIGDKNRVCTGETPFDSYFAPQDNEEHIFLTNNNVTWLTEEIIGNQQLPVPNSSISNTLKSTEKICLNLQNEVTFSINKCNTPKVTSWSTTSNLEIVSSTDYTIIVKALHNNHNSPSFIYANLTNGQTITQPVFIFDQPTVAFNNTALRDAILVGNTLTNETPFYIKKGDRIPVNTTNLPTNVQWKYTREKVYIPPAEPGTEVFYDSASLIGNFVPYTSCLLEDINGNTNVLNSVIGKVPLEEYHFTEDNYRNLPEAPDRPPLPNGMEYASGPEQELAETPSNQSPKISFDKTGYIEAEVTVSNECGCATETNVYKTVNDSTGGSTPISTLPEIDFTLSPNPAQDFFSVNLFRNTTEADQMYFLSVDISLSITSVTTGRAVYLENFVFSDEARNHLLSAWPFPTGVYVVKINSIYGVVSKNLIIE